MERQKSGAEEIWAFSGARQTRWAEAEAGAGVIRWPDFRHARQGKWPKSRIIGASERKPKIRIIDVSSPVQLPNFAFLQMWFSSSLSPFCKGDYCRQRSKKGDGWKEKSGQWGSAIHNEDPTMIWGNLDNRLQDAWGPPWQRGRGACQPFQLANIISESLRVGINNCLLAKNNMRQLILLVRELERVAF